MIDVLKDTLFDIKLADKYTPLTASIKYETIKNELELHINILMHRNNYIGSLKIDDEIEVQNSISGGFALVTIPEGSFEYLLGKTRITSNIRSTGITAVIEVMPNKNARINSLLLIDNECSIRVVDVWLDKYILKEYDLLSNNDSFMLQMNRKYIDQCRVVFRDIAPVADGSYHVLVAVDINDLIFIGTLKFTDLELACKVSALEGAYTVEEQYDWMQKVLIGENNKE